jgi:hypothetical protein
MALTAVEGVLQPPELVGSARLTTERILKDIEAADSVRAVHAVGRLLSGGDDVCQAPLGRDAADAPHTSGSRPSRHEQL